MPISRQDLIQQFGDAIELGNGALFVGAGISSGVGLPGWFDLIEKPRQDANIPTEIVDAPLMAQYIADSRVGRDHLNRHILETISKGVPWEGNKNHQLIKQLGLKEIWTTNYDRYLETACKGATVVYDDETVQKINTGATTIFKMHGSVSEKGDSWEQDPILTRSDYESYEDNYRRIWTLLHATYLSRRLLFLGFSFTDPNIELLQKLARRYGTASTDKHLAIMKKPVGPEERRHELQREDLERTGIQICEISDYKEITEILADLAVRTRPLRLFISGSDPEEGNGSGRFFEACKEIGSKIGVESGWQFSSLGGDAGWAVSENVWNIRGYLENYDPAQIVFHVQKKAGPSEPLGRRIGTVVHSTLTRADLVPSVLRTCRALLVVGGGKRTLEEISWAQNNDVGVVPLAFSGGAARTYWEKVKDSPMRLGSQDVLSRDWDALGSEDTTIACMAAVKLLRQAMFKAE